jgi:hypothetical protein
MGLDASKMIVLEAREGHLVLPYVHVLEGAFCKPGFPCAATITLIQNCWNVVGRVGYTQPNATRLGFSGFLVFSPGRVQWFKSCTLHSVNGNKHDISRYSKIG